MTTLFPLGQVVATPDALTELQKNGQTPVEFLARHVSGDWGEDLPKEDARENQRALKNGNRIMSAYTLKDGAKIWIITEADRSVTTVLLPENY